MATNNAADTSATAPKRISLIYQPHGGGAVPVMLTMDAGVIARAVLLVAEQERKAHLAREYVERFRQRLELRKVRAAQRQTRRLQEALLHPPIQPKDPDPLLMKNGRPDPNAKYRIWIRDHFNMLQEVKRQEQARRWERVSEEARQWNTGALVFDIGEGQTGAAKKVSASSKRRRGWGSKRAGRRETASVVEAAKIFQAMFPDD